MKAGRATSTEEEATTAREVNIPTDADMARVTINNAYRRLKVDRAA